MKRKLMCLLLIAICFVSSVKFVSAEETDSDSDREESLLSEEHAPRTRSSSGHPYVGSWKDYPGIQVIEPSDSIPSAYAFMPNVSGSEVVVFGTPTTNDSILATFYWDDIVVGESGILYKSVGNYNGVELDLKVTIIGFDVSGSMGYVQLSKISMDLLLLQGNVKLHYEYFEHGTNHPVEVSGYHNFNDIDLHQYIRIYNDVNIKQFYVTSDNVLSYYDGDDYVQVGDDNNIGTTKHDRKAWLNYTYENTSSYTLYFACTHDAYFAYTYEALVAIPQPITVKYLDTNGNPISEDFILTGDLDTTYTTSAISIPGYTLVETPSNANGVFTTDIQTVTYVYAESNVFGTVLVQYVDTEGNKIAEDEPIVGEIGIPYTTQPVAKEIAGYTLVETPNNETGTFIETMQTVVYVYKKDVESYPNTSDNNYMGSLCGLTILMSLSLLYILNKKTAE